MFDVFVFFCSSVQVFIHLPDYSSSSVSDSLSVSREQTGLDENNDSLSDVTCCETLSSFMCIAFLPTFNLLLAVVLL